MPRRPAELFRRYLPCDSSAPRRVRQALGALEEIEPVRDDAVLVATELVSNAIRHSGCDPSDEVEVVAEALPTGLRIAVTDPGRSQSTPILKPGFPGHGGIGLRIVDAIARRWGSERRKGMRVWAELPI